MATRSEGNENVDGVHDPGESDVGAKVHDSSVVNHSNLRPWFNDMPIVMNDSAYGNAALLATDVASARMVAQRSTAAGLMCSRLAAESATIHVSVNATARATVDAVFRATPKALVDVSREVVARSDHTVIPMSTVNVHQSLEVTIRPALKAVNWSVSNKTCAMERGAMSAGSRVDWTWAAWASC